MSLIKIASLDAYSSVISLREMNITIALRNVDRAKVVSGDGNLIPSTTLEKKKRSSCNLRM